MSDNINVTITEATNINVTVSIASTATGGAVSSVFSRTGAVTAEPGDYTTDEVTEGSNLYYTDARVNANANVQANTAKVSNATHTGDVTGATTLTVASSAISGKSSNTDLAGTEEVLINNSGTLEKTTTQDIADLGGGGGGGLTNQQVISQNAFGSVVRDAGGSSGGSAAVASGILTLQTGANSSGGAYLIPRLEGYSSFDIFAKNPKVYTNVSWNPDFGTDSGKMWFAIVASTATNSPTGARISIENTITSGNAVWEAVCNDGTNETRVDMTSAFVLGNRPMIGINVQDGEANFYVEGSHYTITTNVPTSGASQPVYPISIGAKKDSGTSRNFTISFFNFTLIYDMP